MIRHFSQVTPPPQRWHTTELLCVLANYVDEGWMRKKLCYHLWNIKIPAFAYVQPPMR